MTEKKKKKNCFKEKFCTGLEPVGFGFFDNYFL